mmetsp:Transcript_10268/g.30915  ORF Transcript_10268/g.30915 Transcript_10268/m.30915 type:complete len:222 (-) Transcript_10268:421-1086(-)
MAMSLASVAHSPAMPADLGARSSRPVSGEQDQSSCLFSSTRKTVQRSACTSSWACVVTVRTRDCVPRSCERACIMRTSALARSLVTMAARYTSAFRRAMLACCERFSIRISSTWLKAWASCLLMACKTPLHSPSKSTIGMARRLSVLWPVCSSKAWPTRPSSRQSGMFTVSCVSKTWPAIPCPGLTRMGCSRFEALRTSMSMHLSYTKKNTPPQWRSFDVS